MNTPNNKRRRQSQEQIETAFVRLLTKRKLRQIKISAICHGAGVNRSTFYANYDNIDDLVEKIGRRIETEFAELYRHEVEQGYNSNDFLKLFRHIKDNKLFYKVYFDLGLDAKIVVSQYDYELAKEHFNGEFIDYHIEFFRAGFNAVVRKWLENGCEETPEEILEVIKSEYKNRDRRSS